MTVTTAAKSPPRARPWPWTRVLRYVVQAVFVGVILNSAIRHHVAGGDASPIPSLDALCPFGGIEAAYSYIMQGQFLPKTALSNLVLLGGLLLGILFAGEASAAGSAPLAPSRICSPASVAG